MKYRWVCNICGESGRSYLSRHKAMRSARGHTKRNDESFDITFVRFDGKIERTTHGELIGKTPA